MTETLDWLKLASDVVPTRGRVPYEENKHFFTKVAFDVFQFNASPVESLWVLESDKDGKQYLVARYEEDAKALESKSNWMALVDKESKNVTLAYKSIPIQRFASSDFNFTKDDAHIFQKMLVQKALSDKSFVKKILESQPKEKQQMLLTLFPELV